MPAPKPVELLILEGTAKRPKAELEFRKANEIRIGKKNFKMPNSVGKRPDARKMWRRLADLYADFSFVTSADATIIERYCHSYADYVDLRNRKEELCEFLGGDMFSLEKLKGIDDVLTLDNAINKKMVVLQNCEDRLFLNPRARAQYVPKKPKDNKTDPLAAAGFGNV